MTLKYRDEKFVAVPSLSQFEVSFHRIRVSPEESSSMVADALLAPKPQPVLASTILAKLTLLFAFFVFAARFHLRPFPYRGVYCILA